MTLGRQAKAGVPVITERAGTLHAYFQQPAFYHSRISAAASAATSIIFQVVAEWRFCSLVHA